MSQSLEDAESVHADSANVVSPILNSSDEAGQKKNDKAGDSTYDKLANRVSENPHTSLTSKEDRPRKSRKRKRNSPSSCPEIVKRPNKKERKKQKSRPGKWKRPPSSSLSFTSSSSCISFTKLENEMVDKRFKIIP